MTQFDYGNDLRATFSYDSRHRVSTIDAKDGQTSFLDLDFTFDNNTNITQLINGWRDTGSDWNSDTESYSYDGVDRLTSASCNSWSHTYSYDKVGNISAKDSVTYTINTVNEVTSLSDGTSFTYDDNGNRTQKTKGTDTWDYTYDVVNRLIALEKNATTLGEYVYDGDGKRLQATENSVTTTYMYDGLNVVYEKNSTGITAYIYGPTGKLARRTTINQTSNTYFYHTDHLGSTRLVTDGSKNIVAAATYHPFGDLSTVEGPERYLFTGKEKDATGLYYYGARYYDPEIGRFVTRDPYTSLPDDPRVISNSAGAYAGPTNPQKLNRYSYAGNNPVRFNDPSGLCFECAEIRYELTHENSLDSIEFRMERIGVNLDSYLGISISLLNLGSLGNGTGQNCYWIAVKKCTDPETGEVAVTEVGRQRHYYSGDKNKDNLSEEQARNAANADLNFVTTLPHDPNCDYELQQDCDPETPPPSTEPPDGSCAGTSLLSIFVGLAVFTVSLQCKRKRN